MCDHFSVDEFSMPPWFTVSLNMPERIAVAPFHKGAAE
jgi:hypothetical protein